MSDFGVLIVHRGQIIVQRDLPDASPIATEAEESAVITVKNDAGIDGVGAVEWTPG